MPAKHENVKRYNLALPVEVFDAIKTIADEQHTTVLEVLRKFVKIGLLIAEIEKRPEASLFIREGKVERQIMVV